MPGRNTPGGDYRYGYNGMEMDNEVSDNGNSYTTEYRQYDSRLGRWKSLDPLMAKYPNMSPYVAFNNNPIFYTDPLGLEGGPYQKGTGVGGTTIYADKGSKITPLKDYNEDGVIGHENGVAYKGVTEGEALSFTFEGDLYTASFDDEGNFKGYWTGSHEEGTRKEYAHTNSTIVHEHQYKFVQLPPEAARDGNGQIAAILDKHNTVDKDLGSYLIDDGQAREIYQVHVEHQTDWAPNNSDGYWTNTTIISDDYLDAFHTAWSLSNPGCTWCDDAQLSPEESALLGNIAVVFGSLRSPNSFMKNTSYTQKVKIQMQQGDYHSFPKSVDAMASYGKVSTITGGDGVSRLKLSIPGVYKGQKGNFTYIKEADGSINHRLFEVNR